jgi:hypothetical protein
LGVGIVKNLIWRLFVALKKTNAIDDFFLKLLWKWEEDKRKLQKMIFKI